MTSAVAPAQNPYQVSASRIELFRTCPFRAYRRYILGIEEPDTDYSVFGRAVHEILNGAVTQAKASGRWPTRRGIKPLIELYTAAAADTGLLSKTALGEIGTIARRGLLLLEEVPLDADFLAAEHHFSIPIPGMESIEFQGFFDLCYVKGNEVHIWDWKTSRKPYEVTQDPKRQLLLYGLAATILFPYVDRVFLRLNFLRHNAISTCEFDDTLKAQAITYLQEETRNILSYQESGVYPATPGSQCRNCPAAVVCPAAGTPEVNLDLWTDEDAQALFRIYLAIEARLNAIKSRLRSWVDSNGTIKLPEGYFLGYHRSVGMVWDDKNKLLEVLKQCGLDPMEFFVPDNAKLRETAEDYPALAQIAKWKETSCQFRHSGTDPDLAP